MRRLLSPFSLRRHSPKMPEFVSVVPGAGVTTGEYHDRDRAIVKEREPSERTTVIKKQDEMGNRSKTVIHHNN